MGLKNAIIDSNLILCSRNVGAFAISGRSFLFMATTSFSNTTDKNGAIQICEFQCGLGDGGISGDSARLKLFTTLLNIANSETWHEIFMANSGWKYDDGNNSDLPQGTQNLSNGVSKYALPTTALAIERIEVLDNSGRYSLLTPISQEDIKDGVDTLVSPSGIPLYYRLLGGTVELLPAPATGSVTMTNGLKVYFKRGSSSFSSSDTTKTFGFASEYHDIPPRKASIAWLSINKPTFAGLSLLIQKDVDRKSTRLNSSH